MSQCLIVRRGVSGTPFMVKSSTLTSVTGGTWSVSNSSLSCGDVYYNNSVDKSGTNTFPDSSIKYIEFKIGGGALYTFNKDGVDVKGVSQRLYSGKSLSVTGSVWNDSAHTILGATFTLTLTFDGHNLNWAITNIVQTGNYWNSSSNSPISVSSLSSYVEIV